MLTVTKITAIKPGRLSKTYMLSDGSLTKETSAQLQKGKVEVLALSSLKDFADLLEGLSPAQALAYGVPVDPAAETLVTKRALNAKPVAAGLTARSKEHFRWPDGGGIMMLDYDPAPGEEPLSRDELVAILTEAVPGVAKTQMLWWQSSSSHICTHAGDDLTGLRGQRIYLPVAEAGDITRAGAVLQERLWLIGQGRIVISKSGAMLERTAFDGVVWQPTRLDFASGAATGPGLEQRRTRPVLLNKDGETLLDTRAALPELDVGGSALVAEAKKALRSEMSVEAALTREAWLKTRRREGLAALGANAPAEDIKTLEDALDQQVLGSDFVLFVQDPMTQSVTARTVEEIFQDPVKYDRCACLDPVEPDYDGGRLVGKLFLSGPSPALHSFARGGQTWTFMSSIAEITIEPGKTSGATEALLPVMRNDARLFDYGGTLVTVTPAGLLELNEHSLELMLSKSVQFHTPVKSGGLRAVDPPSRLLKQVLSLESSRQLKPLEGLLSSPTVREDGELLVAPGYDPKSQLFLNFQAEDYPEIPITPTTAAARNALQTIWSQDPLILA